MKEVLKMSRIEKILRAMIDGTSYGEEPQSRIEAILLAIKNNTQYSHLPHSRIEEILLAIKNNTSYDKEPMSRIEEILLAKLNLVEYKKPVQSKIEKLLLKWLYQDLYLTLKGVPPLTFTTNGQPLVDWTIYGNTINGESVGDRTANLFNGDLQKGYWINATDLGQTSSEAFRSFKIFLPAGTYTLSFEINVNIVRLIADGTLTQNVGNNLTEYTFTTQTNNDVGFSFRITGTSQVPWDNSDIMLNIGSVAIPYEPYGYRVPVTIDGKNLLQNTVKSQTKNGVTFTVNNDGSVTCNGTASNNTFFKIGDLSLTSQSYILTGCPSNGGKFSYTLRCYKNGNIIGVDDGNGVNINESIDGYIEIRIASGYTCDNLTFYPMVRKADIEDDTYEPYYEPITTNLYLPEQIKMVGDEAEYADYQEQKLHRVRKNLLQNTVKSQTKNGVTFTVNNDGSVTCNGTASNNTFFKIGDLSLTSQSYILTGCPSNGGKFSYTLRCYKNGNIIGVDDGNGVNINESIDGYIEIRIASGYTCDNLTFYPMVRKADIEDDTYELYIENVDLDVTLPALPTLSGTNTLTVGTEVQPSNMEIIYAPKEPELKLMMKKIEVMKNEQRT